MNKKFKDKLKVWLLFIICLLGSSIINKIFAQEKQLPRIDTVEKKPVFTDKEGVSYQILKSDNNRSYIVKYNKKGKEYKQFLFRKPETNE